MNHIVCGLQHTIDKSRHLKNNIYVQRIIKAKKKLAALGIMDVTCYKSIGSENGQLSHPRPFVELAAD